MLETIPGSHHISMSPETLLEEGEIIVIVDDDPQIRKPLREYLETHGLPVAEAGSAGELWSVLKSAKAALILLDIGLPDTDGLTLLPDLVTNHPRVGIVMLTGMADLQVAIECIRKGADDYLSKPVQFQEILLVVRKVLERRRLIFENLKYQQDLENANFRIHLVHQLSLKMNSVYLSTVELDEILQAILVGITAEEGLSFNRAFLAIFDEESMALEGRMAIGAHCREEAGRIWNELRDKNLDFMDIVQNIRESCMNGDSEVNELIKSLNVPVTETGHILIKSAMERRSILVEHGQSEVPVPDDLLELLGEDTFVVVPLNSPNRFLGVIIADNFVTRQPITTDHIRSLETFAGQASLAIEHSRLYVEMQNKIGELEDLTGELDKNKDMLVDAERFSALGQMSAQLVHVLRNPITSIGGAARILAKKIDDEKYLEFVKMIVDETTRLESTLQDLFDFVREPAAEKKCVSLYPLIRKTLMLVQPALEKQSIEVNLDLPEPDPVLEIDVPQIRKMLLHLVKNGVEAMPGGGTLAISVRQKKKWTAITVADTGMGLPESARDKATDPFFTTKTYGTGLGLTFVERIVKSHGGNFALSRKEDGGMEARISLPEKISCSFGI
ncbi:MAG: response regulator [Proteobacteria bacterium]|nr:response regulator [Pseudomonadota bacterium]